MASGVARACDLSTRNLQSSSEAPSDLLFRRINWPPNKYLHTISCSQDLRVTSDFILTESHIIVGTARK